MHAYMNTRSMGSLKSLRNGGSSSRLTMEKTPRVIPAHLTRGHAKFVRCSGSTSGSSSFTSSTSSGQDGSSSRGSGSGRIIIDGPPRASQQQQQQQSPPVANTTTSSSSPSTSSTPTSSSSSGVAAAAQRQQQRQHQRGPAPARASGGRLPNQADSLFNPSDRDDASNIGLAERVATKSVSDLDYLSELLAIQRDDGPKSLGFFGTRNMGVTHQKLVEILAYAMVSAGNHIYTSGATGTNAAVIKGAVRAGAADLLTVILPQSRSKQPAESRELLEQVAHVIEMPHNDGLSLMDASRICNRQIIGKVQQVICFAFHDSSLLLETCREAKDAKKIVTLFYLD